MPAGTSHAFPVSRVAGDQIVQTKPEDGGDQTQQNTVPTVVFHPDTEQFIAPFEIPQGGRITFISRILCVGFSGDDDGNDMVEAPAFDEMLYFGIHPG